MKRGPILCDYCDMPATRIISRGPPAKRSIVCNDHRDRAMSAVGPYPGYPWLDPPNPERSRFAEVQFPEELIKRFEGYEAR